MDLAQLPTQISPGEERKGLPGRTQPDWGCTMSAIFFKTRAVVEGQTREIKFFESSNGIVQKQNIGKQEWKFF